MRLASLCNHLCQFPRENALQIPVTIRRKTIFDMQATILWKNRRFDEKSVTKSTSAGTHTEAGYSIKSFWPKLHKIVGKGNYSKKKKKKKLSEDLGGKV